jgi:hypothetical protein
VKSPPLLVGNPLLSPYKRHTALDKEAEKCVGRNLPVETMVERIGFEKWKWLDIFISVENVFTLENWKFWIFVKRNHLVSLAFDKTTIV